MTDPAQCPGGLGIRSEGPDPLEPKPHGDQGWHPASCRAMDRLQEASWGLRASPRQAEGRELSTVLEKCSYHRGGHMCQEVTETNSNQCILTRKSYSTG